MAVVVATISSVGFYTKDDGVYLIYTPFHEKSDDTGMNMKPDKLLSVKMIH